jgi:hypothetical protein
MLEPKVASLEILDIIKSPSVNKRFRVYLNDDTYYDFGLKNGQTYLDHKEELLKVNYWKRHIASPRENYLINNLIPSPALFSAYLLWGPYPNIYKNIENLNYLFKNH